MLKRFRIALVIVALVLFAYIGNFAYRQLNQPSDLHFGAGVLILVALVVFGPSTIAMILRKTRPLSKACGIPEEGTSNDSQTPPNHADSASAGT